MVAMRSSSPGPGDELDLQHDGEEQEWPQVKDVKN